MSMSNVYQTFRDETVLRDMETDLRYCPQSPAAVNTRNTELFGPRAPFTQGRKISTYEGSYKQKVPQPYEADCEPGFSLRTGSAKKVDAKFITVPQPLSCLKKSFVGDSFCTDDTENEWIKPRLQMRKHNAAESMSPQIIRKGPGLLEQPGNQASKLPAPNRLSFRERVKFFRSDESLRSRLDAPLTPLTEECWEVGSEPVSVGSKPQMTDDRLEEMQQRVKRLLDVHENTQYGENLDPSVRVVGSGSDERRSDLVEPGYRKLDSVCNDSSLMTLPTTPNIKLRRTKTFYFEASDASMMSTSRRPLLLKSPLSTLRDNPLGNDSFASYGGKGLQCSLNYFGA